MPGEILDKVARLMRQRLAFAVSADDDGTLLSRFANGREEAAFAELVTRHGTMVLSFCRRRLRDEGTAEDAFQACFLVLAKKAGSVAWRSSVAGWLYEVATRVCRKLGATPRHRSLEDEVMSREPASDEELREVVEAELARLPEHYRSAVVLCGLEGKSTEEAAQASGCAAGTIKSRLARGRELLRGRLERRGVVVASSALAALLTPTLSSAVSPALQGATVAAGITFATGAGLKTVAAKVAQAVLQAMALSKAKVAGGFLVAVLLVLGLGLALRPFRPAEAVSAPPPKPPAAAKPLEEPLPHGVVARLGSTRFRVGAQIHSFDVAPDGSRIAVIGMTSVILVFDAHTGKLLQRLGEDTKPHTVRFHPDGRRLLSQHAPTGTIRVWDASGKHLRTIEAKDEIWHYDLSPNGDALALTVGVITGKTPDGQNQHKEQIEIRDLETGRVQRTFGPFSPHRMGAIKFHADGKSLVAIAPMFDKDRAVELIRMDWTAGTLERRRRMGSSIWPPYFTPDGRTLATAGHGLQLWDPLTGELLAVRAKEFGAADTVLTTPDGKAAMVRDPGQTGMLGTGDVFEIKPMRMLLWDLEKDREIRAFERGLHPVAFTRDGKTVFSANFHGVIERWDVATGKQQAPFLEGHSAPVTGLCFSPDGKRLVSSAEQTLRVWEARTGKPLQQTDGPVGRRHRFTPDANVLVSGAAGVFFWNAQTWKHDAEGASYGESAFDLSPDGKLLATLGPTDFRLRDHDPGEITLWQLPARKKIGVLRPPGKEAQQLNLLTFSKTGLLASAIGPLAPPLLPPPPQAPGGNPVTPRIQIWDVGRKKLLHDWPAAETHLATLDFSADEILLLGFQDGTIRLCDPATGKERVRIKHKGDGPFNLLTAITSDGKVVASADTHHDVVRFWDGETGKALGEFRGHLGTVYSLAFSPDGTLLATGGADTTVLVIDVARVLGRK